MRYDQDRAVYRDCRWCGGRGCLQCEIEADKAYKQSFPNGAQPIATFNLNDPDSLARAKDSISAGAIQEASSEGKRRVVEFLKTADGQLAANLARGFSDATEEEVIATLEIQFTEEVIVENARKFSDPIPTRVE